MLQGEMPSHLKRKYKDYGAITFTFAFNFIREKLSGTDTDWRGLTTQLENGQRDKPDWEKKMNQIGET